jgi:hypothetical protein
MVSSKQLRLTRSAVQMADAVPQVVLHRVARMMAAGVNPNRRDQDEFYRMGAEKVAAFGESWAAMSMQAVAAQQQFAAFWLQTWWKMALGGWLNPPSLQQLSSSAQHQWMNSVLDMAARGMAPVHRRAVANAKRLNSGKR